jgi:hypothetical protein
MALLPRLVPVLLVSLSLQAHGGNRDTVFGELPTEMENLEASDRSHGSLHESEMPLVIYNCKEEVPPPESFKRNADLSLHAALSVPLGGA